MLKCGHVSHCTICRGDKGFQDLRTSHVSLFNSLAGGSHQHNIMTGRKRVVDQKSLPLKGCLLPGYTPFPTPSIRIQPYRI